MLLNYFAAAMKGMHRRHLFNKDLWYKSATPVKHHSRTYARAKNTTIKIYSII